MTDRPSTDRPSTGRLRALVHPALAAALALFLGGTALVGTAAASVAGTAGPTSASADGPPGSPGSGASAVPLPTATGPIAVTGSSYPFNGVEHNRTPRRLGTSGYVEQEFLVSGTANVYDRAAGDSLATIGSGPYTTRILVRRPASGQHFSGRVVVEMLNPTSFHDLDIMWAATQDQLIKNGDAWVGVTIKPTAIAALKRFDDQRYGSLSMANPRTTDCTTTWSDATPATENGLVWDMVSQVGRLVRSNAATSPLHGLEVTDAYLTGYSQTGGYEVTYVNAIAPHATLPGGSPVYDGYLIGSGNGFPVPINQCAPAPAPGSDEAVIQPPGSAPVISVQTLSDFAALGGLANRRHDSTGAKGNYRLYEVAGSAHVWAEQVAYAPGGDELVKSGFPSTWWDPYCDQDVTTFPLQYALDGALVNLEDWAERGRPAPHAPRIKLSDPTDPASVVTDRYGNVRGGLRLPAISAPRATYYGTSDGTGTCRILWGHQVDFVTSTLERLYPHPQSYPRTVLKSVRDAASRRWITPNDARAIVAEARRVQRTS